MAGALVSSEEGEALVRWFLREGRKLPWRREGASPWERLVAEFLLQQTRVATILPRYPEILKELSTPQACAALPEARLLKLWEGLGYYRRAKALQRTARILCERFHGELPRDLATLKTLPGVGEYTAAAVLALAFQEPVPVADGNILRVFARRFALSDPRSEKGEKLLSLWFSTLYEAGSVPAVVQGLMDLGATICLPRAPRCHLCPLQPFCRGKRDPLRFPRKKPKKEPPVEEWLHLWITWEDSFLLERRPPGLLGGYLAPLLKPGAFPPEERIPLAGGEAVQVQVAPPYLHRFTHRTWKVQAVHYALESPGILEVHESPFTLVPRKELPSLPLPRAFARGGAWLFPELFPSPSP